MWHVEVRDLQSLNYMHSGAPKTWYGDVMLAFVHGYSGEVNSLETFAMLGDKTTVISSEVLVDSGILCCRLVQNAGECMITFPGSYHCGFSHGGNNIIWIHLLLISIFGRIICNKESTDYSWLPPRLGHDRNREVPLLTSSPAHPGMLPLRPTIASSPTPPRY
uniref:REF6 n=1 Tax=Arundo donax TaxID=35708 RepID=A0A0A9C2K5_ARUDO